MQAPLLNVSGACFLVVTFFRLVQKSIARFPHFFANEPKRTFFC